jgi:hypothetical protein
MTSELPKLESLSLTDLEGREKVFEDVNLICHVFSYLLSRDACIQPESFLNKPTRPLASLENMRSLGAKLSRVCQSWRRICNQHMATIVGSDLWVTSTVLSNHDLFLWCFKHNGNPLRPTRIQLYGYDTLNILQLLEKWDLSYLTQFDMIIRRAQDLQSTVATLLSHCNCLVELGIHIVFDIDIVHEKSIQQQYEQVIRQPLFSLPSIQRLHLSTHTREPLQSRLFNPRSTWTQPLSLNPNNILLSNLSNLIYLKLSGDSHYSSPLPIASPTLQVLDVTDLRRVIVPCDCPQLRDYACDILKYSGTLPKVTQEREYRRLMRDYVTPPGKFGHLIVPADKVSFPGLCIPDTCRVTVLNFGYWQNFRTVSYRDRLDEILQAVEGL